MGNSLPAIVTVCLRFSSRGLGDVTFYSEPISEEVVVVIDLREVAVVGSVVTVESSVSEFKSCLLLSSVV